MLDLLQNPEFILGATIGFAAGALSLITTFVVLDRLEDGPRTREYRDRGNRAGRRAPTNSFGPSGFPSGHNSGTRRADLRSTPR